MKIKVFVDGEPITVELGGIGLPGLSAYQIAVNNGFEGTEEEWLASIGGGGEDNSIINAIIFG